MSVSTIADPFKDANHPQVLTQLFFTIGNAQAICQFKDICQKLRVDVFTSIFKSGNVQDVVQALDNIGTKTNELEIFRKYHLYRLTKFRYSLSAALTEHSDSQDHQLATRKRGEVICRMVSASSPEFADSSSSDQLSKEFLDQKKKISDWLEKGRVYRSLADAYGPVETPICKPGSGAQPSTRKYSCSCNRPARSPARNLSTAWTLSRPFALRQPGCSSAFVTRPYPCSNLFPDHTLDALASPSKLQASGAAKRCLARNRWPPTVCPAIAGLPTHPSIRSSGFISKILTHRPRQPRQPRQPC